MKLKAVVQEGCPQELVDELEGAVFRNSILNRVLKKHLRVGEFGPAEFYIQKCDFACGGGAMCEVRLTGVSVNKRRSTEDFENAMEELERIYAEAISEYGEVNGESTQLFVSLMTDKAPLGMGSPLLERKPIYVPAMGKRLS
jgi:hypothetical protein